LRYEQDWDPTKGFYDVLVSLLATLHDVAENTHPLESTSESAEMFDSHLDHETLGFGVVEAAEDHHTMAEE
jgi:hypothetical protein